MMHQQISKIINFDTKHVQGTQKVVKTFNVRLQNIFYPNVHKALHKI
jgi:hypothetical protein